MAKGFWSLLLIYVIVLVGSLSLERQLTNHYILELYLLMLGVIFAIITLAAVLWEKYWGWPLALILTSLFTLNALIMYLADHQSRIVFAVVLLASIIGTGVAYERSGAIETDPLAGLPQMQFDKSR